MRKVFSDLSFNRCRVFSYFCVKSYSVASDFRDSDELTSDNLKTDLNPEKNEKKSDKCS